MNEYSLLVRVGDGLSDLVRSFFTVRNLEFRYKIVSETILKSFW